MSKVALSNRQRKAMHRAQAKAPRHPPGEAVVRVAEDAGQARKDETPPKDGLAWLLKKRRLTAAQVREGMVYREGFRQADIGVSLRSCLNAGVGGGEYGLSDVALASLSDAAAEVLYIRSHVLIEHPDMVTAMDGVCGKGYTLRYLAAGDQLRSIELEVALTIALDLIIDWRGKLKNAA